jgi:hypothetical protein
MYVCMYVCACICMYTAVQVMGISKADAEVLCMYVCMYVRVFVCIQPFK